MLRTNTTFADIADRCRAASTVAVLSHYRPDGDAIGSALAIGLALRAAGKSVRILNEDPLPGTLAFLPGSDLLEQSAPGEMIEADLVIAVDCANRERLGANCLAALAAAPFWINIDHHKSNEGYGDLHYIDAGSPATGEIVYQFLTECGFPVDAAIGENLYVAISTDTGSFQYASTTARTYEIGAALIRAGVDIARVNCDTYESYPRRRVELLRGLLNSMQISQDGRVASWALTRELMESTGAKPEDSEGLIDTLRAIQGVIVAASFEEMAGTDNKIRLSLRSKDPSIDVGRVCALFGGGGHTLAAGARLAGPLSDAQTRVLQAIHETLP